MPHFHASDGARLHYTDEGDRAGTPLLCLAGLTRTGRDFDYVAPHLPPCRLIRLDYRGRGQSEWSGAATYTLPREGQDALELLDHLGLAQAAILGTSRGGLIATGLAATAKDRLLGVALNDIGPKIEAAGLDAIKAYLGRRPAFRTLEEAISGRASVMAGFAGVPETRWAQEVMLHYRAAPDGLDISYDPALREAVLGNEAGAAPDLWPIFDALGGLPLALIRGANSDLLSPETAAEMARRRPDMIRAEVPGRGHVPFLDEPEALGALTQWMALL
ncbi:MAG: alpha/beta hydrolase [Pseudomonadota bacterium]